MVIVLVHNGLILGITLKTFLWQVGMLSSREIGELCLGSISAGGTVTKTTQYTIKGAIKQSADVNSIFNFNDAKVQLDAFSEQ